MVISSQLRPGMALKYQGQNYKVLAAEYHPGQGQMGGVAHVRLQNLDTRTLWEHSFRADHKLEEIPLDKQTLEFLYTDRGFCCFMNRETFEQTEVPQAVGGPQADFLEPGMTYAVEFVDGRPVSILFPGVLEVRIAQTAPATHQQQDTNFKPAKLANGVEVMVPQFIKAGDGIRIDLENLKYVDRVKADAKAKGARVSA
jgi:elongation factor P